MTTPKKHGRSERAQQLQSVPHVCWQVRYQTICCCLSGILVCLNKPFSNHCSNCLHPWELKQHRHSSRLKKFFNLRHLLFCLEICFASMVLTCHFILNFKGFFFFNNLYKHIVFSNKTFSSFSTVIISCGFISGLTA